jgi:hypothetical protein
LATRSACLRTAPPSFFPKIPKNAIRRVSVR